MNNEIISVVQLPIIEERLQQIKSEISVKVEDAKSLVCTPETVQAVKKVRADLNKDFSDLESRRKEVKAAVMLPYDRFEAIYKDCVTNVFKQADADLKAKISAVETELKDQKAQEVVRYFTEYMESMGRGLSEFVSFGNANINVTLSASLKSLKEQAKSYIDRICGDLTLIDTQEHRDEILYEYKQSLNVSAAITSVANRYKAIEAEKAREAERQARVDAAKEAEKKVDEIAPQNVDPPKEVEPILTVSFKVKGTRTQLKALKEFMNNGGYDYE